MKKDFILEKTGCLLNEYIKPISKKKEFVYYRLLDGLQEFTRLKQLRFGKILIEPS